MKSTKWGVVLLLLAMASMGNAWAWHRDHSRVGIYFGPHWGPGYYSSPYSHYSPYYYPPYYPPVVVQRVDPPVYIQQQPTAPEPVQAEAAPQPGYWYYCAAAKGYYPYVKECAAGWQKVAPQPASKP